MPKRHPREILLLLIAGLVGVGIAKFSNFAGYGIAKRFSHFLFSALICALALSGGMALASHEFEGFCFAEERSLEHWVDASETILVGEAKEVTYHLPSRPPGDSACWARFEVKEWLKDSGPSELWVRAAIPSYKRSKDDLTSLRYCEFEKNGMYIIFGRHIRAPSFPFPPEWIGIHSDAGSKSWHCPPHEKISPFGTIIPKVKAIIEEAANE